jgi:gluconate 2-dehydrogenase gamma chain
MTRRDLLVAAAGGVIALAALAGQGIASVPSASTQEQRAMLARLSDIILPETDTPGAVAARVPDYIDMMLAGWYTDVERHHFLAELDIFTLRAGAQDDNTAVSRMLQRYAEGAAGAEGSAFFRELRALVVIGYYTSETGAMRELSYNPVPGVFEGSIPFGEVGWQWSN